MCECVCVRVYTYMYTSSRVRARARAAFMMVQDEARTRACVQAASATDTLMHRRRGAACKPLREPKVLVSSASKLDFMLRNSRLLGLRRPRGLPKMASTLVATSACRGDCVVMADAADSLTSLLLSSSSTMRREMTSVLRCQGSSDCTARTGNAQQDAHSRSPTWREARAGGRAEA